MSSSFSDDQLQPDDTLEDRGVDDVLDEGMSAPERPSDTARGITAREAAEGETLDDRLAQEEPDPTAEIDHSADGHEEELRGEDGTDPSDGFEVGDERTGRLVAAEDGATEEADGLPAAEDAGIDGGAASAEEAAVHTVAEDEV